MQFWLVTGTVKALQGHPEYYFGILLYTRTYFPVLNRNPQDKKCSGVLEFLLKTFLLYKKKYIHIFM
jgi:hypothetical protein